MRRKLNNLFVCLLVSVLLAATPGFARSQDETPGLNWFEQYIIGGKKQFKNIAVSWFPSIERKTYSPQQLQDPLIAAIQGLLDRKLPAGVLRDWESQQVLHPGTVLHIKFVADSGREDIEGVRLRIHRDIANEASGGFRELGNFERGSGMIHLDMDDYPPGWNILRVYGKPRVDKDVSGYDFIEFFRGGNPTVRQVASGEAVDVRTVAANPSTLPPAATPAVVSSPSPVAQPTPQPAATPSPTTTPTPAGQSATTTGDLQVTLKGGNATHVVVYDVSGKRYFVPVRDQRAIVKLPAGAFTVKVWPRGQGLYISGADARKCIEAGKTATVTLFKEGK